MLADDATTQRVRPARRAMPAMPAVLVLLAVTALGLGACSAEVPDAEPTTTLTATDGPTATDDPTGPGTEPATTPPGDGPLAGVEACELVTDDEAAQLGLTDEQADVVGTAPTCSWRYEGATLRDSYTVQISLFAEISIDEVVGTAITPVSTVGTHQAVTYRGPAGGCSAAIAVTDTSRVDAQFVGGDEPLACQLLTEFVAVVEPKLP